jgi:hypothetical protein
MTINGGSFRAIDMGDVKIELPNRDLSSLVILKDYVHAPDLVLTLVSVSCLAEAAKSVVFGKDLLLLLCTWMAM